MAFIPKMVYKQKVYNVAKFIQNYVWVSNGKVATFLTENASYNTNTCTYYMYIWWPYYRNNVSVSFYS